MTDSHLQQLERAWRASGSVEDEVVYLQARLRVGELSPTYLEAAACLGHDPAQRILGGTPTGEIPLHVWWLGDQRTEREPRWSRALTSTGLPRAALRAGIAIALEHLAALDPTDQPNACRLLELAEDEALGGPDGLELARERLATPNVALREFAAFLWPELDSFPTSVELERRPWRRYWRITQEGDFVGLSLRRELVPWLLGYSDPVRERVAARHAER